MTVRKYSEDELKIIDTVDIVEVVEQFVSLSKHGNSYTGFSPFKSEKTPSFSVKPSDKIFKDFSTGIGGNVISFYARMKNISYREAMQELAGIYGIRLSNTTNKFVNKETIYHKILKDANDIFRRNLLENQRALEYMQSRGYSLENLKKYNIGYAKDGWNLLLSELSEKYTVEDIYKSGLITMNNENTNYFDSFRDRIMFPIYNVRNQIIAFGGRYIGSDSESPKYINSVETEIFKKSNELYGIFDMGTALKNNKYATLPELIARDLDNLEVNSYEFKGYSKHISSTKEYFEFNMDILNKEIREELFGENNDRKIFTRMKDTPPALFKKTAEVENSLVSNGCIIEGTLKNSVLSRGTIVEKGAVLENCIVLQDCTIKSNAILKNIIIDKNNIIASEEKLNASPEHPLVIEKQIRWDINKYKDLIDYINND